MLMFYITFVVTNSKKTIIAFNIVLSNILEHIQWRAEKPDVIMWNVKGFFFFKWNWLYVRAACCSVLGERGFTNSSSESLYFCPLWHNVSKPEERTFLLVQRIYTSLLWILSKCSNNEDNQLKRKGPVSEPTLSLSPLILSLLPCSPETYFRYHTLRR